MQAPSAGAPAARAQASLHVQQALEGITRLTKGFSLPLCTRTRPKIGELLQRPLLSALQIPLVQPPAGMLFACSNSAKHPADALKAPCTARL